MAERLPVIFFGHGTPMIAMKENETTQTWREIVASMPRPDRILCISAHWLSRGTQMTGQASPPTIHDFGGFPRAMHEFIYPAPGDPGLVARVKDLLGEDVSATSDWGFDHGCWTVLMKIFPQADIPVVQLSMDVHKSGQQHFDLGRKLRVLRDEGVLIIGSGNLVHNLRDVIRTDDAPARDYATLFGNRIRRAIVERDDDAVIRYPDIGPASQASVPTPDHFWPLLYVLGARHSEDQPSFAPNFVEYSSIDMTTLVLRAPAA